MMPPKKPVKQPAWDITFLRWQMTTDQKNTWKKVQEKTPFAHVDMLDDLIGQGYKISVSFDEKNDTYNCTITCPKTLNMTDNAGYAFSTRAKTALEAMDMGLYKHYVLCDKQQWDTDEAGDGSLG